MEILKTFSSEYANGGTAVIAVLALLLATGTLLYVRREYSNKYRPYVLPVVYAELTSEQSLILASITPHNIGPHPCEFKLSCIDLTIGDETHGSPDFKEWVLASAGRAGVRVPVGQINAVGIQRVRESRYKSNRIEVAFILHTRSVDGRFLSKENFVYEISVLDTEPKVFFRPEWRSDA